MSEQLGSEQSASHRLDGPDYPDHYRLSVCSDCRAMLDVGLGGAYCHRCHATVASIWMIALPHHTESYRS